MLRRHINPLQSPLYRLPLDLFPEIASHLASETDLVNATHISYYLRNVLLSHPRLWSHLDFRREMRARSFVERSGQTPLHLDMARDTERTVDSLAELRQQSKRIATLKLRYWSIQKAFLSEPLPSLRRLEIFFGSSDDSDWDEGWDYSWGRVWGPTEKATTWSFPSLTSLVVYNLIPIPFHTPLLTRFKFWDEDGTTDTDKLLRFLDNCPLLEHIDILSGGHCNGQDLVVSLPNLRTYTETTSKNQPPLTVLDMLSLPPFCSVTLRFQDGETAAEADDILPHLKSPNYLAEIKRVKLGATLDAYGRGMAGTLELVNAKGTKVCFKRTSFEEGRRPLMQGSENHAYSVAYLNFLRSLDYQPVEVLCIDGYTSLDGAVVGFLKEMLSFGNVGTLILSKYAVEPCLPVIRLDPDPSRHSQWSSSIHTLIIRSDPDEPYLRQDILESLIITAYRRKEAGFPFRSVSLFLEDERYKVVLKELRKCVGKPEVVVGDDILDWDVDKYFLDGLDHLQRNQDVQWD